MMIHPNLLARLKRRHAIATLKNKPQTIKTGDRVAFITYGNRPHALCGVVVSANVTNKNGRHRHRVICAGKLYMAHPKAIRKLSP